MGSPRPKPRLRGVSHELAVSFAVVGAAALVHVAPSRTAVVGAIVYGASLAALFGFSALYHRPMWSLRPRRWLKRLDHSMIFVFIAGCYTPFCLALGGRTGTVLLWIAWSGALFGVARVLFWLSAPRWLSTASYVLLGFVVVPFLPALWRTVGGGGIGLLAAGGALYCVGAWVYATRRPDPNPRVFGYHEIFHLLVIAAAGLQYGVVLSAIRSIR